MANFLALPALKPFVLFSALLVFKVMALAFITARRRAKAGVVVNPEDVKVNPGAHAEAQDAPEVLRAKRAHGNDVENIPFFLICAGIYTMLGASSTAGWAYFGLYFGIRTLYTIFYLAEVQPFRTLSFGIGQVTLIGVLVQMLMKVLKG